MAPDEWQALILDDWLSERRGKWAALTCGLAVPRQNGKNGVLEIREIFGMVGLGEKFLHTAHEVKTAQKHFRRLKHFFGTKANDPAARYPELNALVTQVRSVNGQEAIFLSNGGSVEVVARSKNSSRGFTVDVLVFDEAQELDEDAKEALIPTTSSAPLGNPQWIYTGTPPGPKALGEAFINTRTTILSGKRERASWIEWSIETGEVSAESVRDSALIYATNPQLDRVRPNGTFGLQWETVEGEMDELTPDGFARERLGQWPSEGRLPRAIPADLWGEGIDKAPEGVRSYGVKFSVDGLTVSLAVAVKHDGGVHLELVKHLPARESEALAVQLASVWRKSAVTVVDGKSGAGAFVEMLHREGVPRRKSIVHRPTADEYTAAHKMFMDELTGGRLSHFAGEDQKPLDDAVAAAVKREIGNLGGWGWDSMFDDVDVTPLDAATLALFGALTTKRNPERKGRGVVM